MYSDKQQREIFHILFLERLLRISDPKLYILKGGVNLRFFFNSPRYSEDMDMDVLEGSIETLKKNGYKILNDPSLKRALQTYGVEDLKINDPSKAKHTSTTQRFKCRLVNSSGEEFPTKVEFSRRSPPAKESFILETIPPEVSRPYKRLSFACQHYGAHHAILQKVEALAGRPETQARDVFDLYTLYLGGHLTATSIKDFSTKNLRAKALSAMHSLSYEDYKSQVVEYFSPDTSQIMGERSAWVEMTKTLESFLQ